MTSEDPDSLARSVSQALQAGQVTVVANIVTSFVSEDIIQGTVALLPAESVLPLLAVIQSKFENGRNDTTPLSLSKHLLVFRSCGRAEPRPVVEISADWPCRLPDVSP